jgi:hypothetical protein
MEITQLLLTILVTALFCNGWAIVTSEENVLHFIARPFERAYDNIEHYNERLLVLKKFDANNKGDMNYCQRMINRNTFIYYIGKPFVLCVTCMSSIWGSLVFVVLNGIGVHQLPYLIISCIASAFLNSLTYRIYAKLD